MPGHFPASSENWPYMPLCGTTAMKTASPNLHSQKPSSPPRALIAFCAKTKMRSSLHRLAAHHG
eukprot:2262321-Prorocentrum_lima.AAC.1